MKQHEFGSLRLFPRPTLSRLFPRPTLSRLSPRPALRRVAPRLALCLLLGLVIAALGTPPPARAAEKIIRVGVYSNEPKEFVSARGKPSGIFVDLLEEMARREGWQLVWINGTFAEGMKALEEGTIDVMPDVAFTDARAKLYDFHKTPVVESWSYVYAGPGHQIERLSDLRNMRVAVVKGSVQETELSRLSKGFGLNITLVSVDSFTAAFQAAEEGSVDAAAANYFFGDHFYERYRLHRTSIVFNPVPLYYATAKGRNAEILATIDRYLNEWTKQPDSPYYKVLSRYTVGVTPVSKLPRYLLITAALTIGLLLLATLLVLVLRWRVKAETSNLLQAQTELRTALERLKYHVENSPLASIQFDKDLRISQWSATAEKLFGYRAEEVLGRGLDEFHWVHEDDAPLVDAMMADMLNGRDVSNVHTNRNYRKDGSVVLCEWYNSALTDEQGHLVSIMSLALDITERERAAEAIRRQSAALAGLLEVSAVLAATVDLDTVLRVIVESALCLSGELDTGFVYLLQEDDLRLAASVPPLNGEAGALASLSIADQDRLRQCLDSREPVVVADTLTTDLNPAETLMRATWDSRTIIYLPLVTAEVPLGALVLGVTGQPRTFTSEEIDLYRTLCSQAALAIENARLFEQTAEHARTLELRVAERTAELSVALEKSKELDRLKSMFIATMSHELRTPLNSIIGFSSVLISEWAGPLNEEQKENVNIVMRAGKHLLALINDVIDVSKIEAGKVEITIEDFDLADVIGEVEEMLAKQAEEQGLALVADELHVALHSDRRRVLQALLNLATNAVKFTEKGGVRITPVLSADGDAVEIAVADTGIGIPEDKREQLFGAFVRIDSPLRGKVPGTGLGLHLTQKLAEEILGGTITYAENPGGGSIFTLRVPVRIGGPT